MFLGVSSTPGPRTLPGCHPASPSACGVHGTKGSCPLRADTLLVDNVSDTCTPEFSAQMSPSSLPRSTQASSQVYPPTTSRATGLGVVTAEQQLWGVDRGQTWVGVSICIHTVWGGAEVCVGGAGACSPICAFASGPTTSWGEPAQGQRLRSASSLPSKAALKLYHPSAFL